MRAVRGSSPETARLGSGTDDGYNRPAAKGAVPRVGETRMTLNAMEPVPAPVAVLQAGVAVADLLPRQPVPDPDA